MLSKEDVTACKQFVDVALNSAGVDADKYPIFIGEKVTGKEGINVYEENDEIVVAKNIIKNGKLTNTIAVHKHDRLDSAYVEIVYTIYDYLNEKYHLCLHDVAVMMINREQIVDKYDEVFHAEPFFDAFWLKLQNNLKLLSEVKHFVVYLDYEADRFSLSIDGLTAERIHDRVRNAIGTAYVDYLASFAIMLTIAEKPELANRLNNLLDQLDEACQKPNNLKEITKIANEIRAMSNMGDK